MTISEYVVDIALIAVVLLQIRERRITPRSFLLPLAIVTAALASYLQPVPTAGNDSVLVAGGAALGIVLGFATAATTHLRRGRDGGVLARAGAAAAGLWVLGVGARFAFELYATHGGQAAIGRFSLAHGITSSGTWVDALLFMAVGEVLARSAMLGIRWRSARTVASTGA